MKDIKFTTEEVIKWILEILYKESKTQEEQFCSNEAAVINKCIREIKNKFEME